MTSKASNQARTGRKKIRYAVVGQGYFAQEAALPAFEHAKNSELVALVSGDETKLKKLGRKYGVEHTLGYEEYDDFLARGEVDAVYIALPNHLHADYTIRAARAGVHVLCEKPMAVTEKECEQMMRAAEENNIKLMIAYRLHHETANLQAVEIAQSGKLGEVRHFDSTFTMEVEPGNIRVQRETGGGTLYDIGIYCINAARYLFQAEPVGALAITAGQQDEVEEMASAILRFPDNRTATFTCSFGAAKVSSYRLVGTKGDLRVEPAYPYADDLKHYLTIKGKTRARTFPKRDQVAAEFVYFSDCILNDKDPEPSGLEGLIDVQIIRALYRSAQTGRPVRLDLAERNRRPTRKQEIRRPPVEKPKLINAEPPPGKD